MTIEAERARQLLYAVHDAWNAKDVDGMLSHFADDLTYWANVGGPDRGPSTIQGKEEFRKHLLQWTAVESICVPHHFRFADGLGRASVEFYVTDLKSGHTYTGTYRQIAAYRDGKILDIKVYHDASALGAFLELIASSRAPARMPAPERSER
jgi:ketosteroid isomerase-like protein